MNKVEKLKRDVFEVRAACTDLGQAWIRANSDVVRLTYDDNASTAALFRAIEGLEAIERRQNNAWTARSNAECRLLDAVLEEPLKP